MPFQPPSRPATPASVEWGGNQPKPQSPPPASPGKPPVIRPNVRRLGWLAVIVVAFLLGGLSPARADNSDRLLQYLDRIADSLRELAHREVRVVCECKS